MSGDSHLRDMYRDAMDRIKELEVDRDSWRRLAERYETNCTGRHGSQMSCGSFSDTAAKPK
jgi:hypothetical protein